MVNNDWDPAVGIERKKCWRFLLIIFEMKILNGIVDFEFFKCNGDFKTVGVGAV
jgi:hypothetical protein